MHTLDVTWVGSESTFASGLSGPYGPYGMAIDQDGDLFVADSNSLGGNIYEFSPGGVRSTFATGLSEPSP